MAPRNSKVLLYTSRAVGESDTVMHSDFIPKAEGGHETPRHKWQTPRTQTGARKAQMKKTRGLLRETGVFGVSRPLIELKAVYKNTLIYTRHKYTCRTYRIPRVWLYNVKMFFFVFFFPGKIVVVACGCPRLGSNLAGRVGSAKGWPNRMVRVCQSSNPTRPGPNQPDSTREIKKKN